MSTQVLTVAVSLAATVAFIEAFTIVLAIRVSRGWRSAVAGTVWRRTRRRHIDAPVPRLAGQPQTLSCISKESCRGLQSFLLRRRR